MLSASLLGRVSPSELRWPGMGAGCHGYHPDWPKAWFPVKGPCECEGGKAPPPPPAFPSLAGGNSATFQRTLKDLRMEKRGMSYTCWTLYMVRSPTIHHISFKKTECMTKLAFASWYVYNINACIGLPNEITFGMLNRFSFQKSFKTCTIKLFLPC